MVDAPYDPGPFKKIVNVHFGPGDDCFVHMINIGNNTTPPEVYIVGACASGYTVPAPVVSMTGPEGTISQVVHDPIPHAAGTIGGHELLYLAVQEDAATFNPNPFQSYVAFMGDTTVQFAGHELGISDGLTFGAIHLDGGSFDGTITTYTSEEATAPAPDTDYIVSLL